MILGAEGIVDYIKNGVLARFEADGKTQSNVDGHIKTSDLGRKFHFPLIENLPDDFEIEGCSVDMTIKEIFIKTPIDGGMQLGSVLGVSGRNTGGIIEATEQTVHWSKNNNTKYYVIDKGYQYIAVTNEKVNMPLNLLAKPMPRVTMFTAGLLVQVGIVNPNYFGPLKFGIVNMTQEPVLIEKGFRAITLTFEQVLGGVNAYHGFHQGGDKLSTHGQVAPSR